MKFARTCIALAAIIAPGSFSGQTTISAQAIRNRFGRSLFQAGSLPKLTNFKLAQIRRSKSEGLFRNHSSWGRVALLSNRALTMRRNGWKSHTLQPGDADATVMLAEVFLSPRRFPKGSGFAERRRREHNKADYFAGIRH